MEDDLTYHGVHAGARMKRDEHMKLWCFHLFSIILLHFFKKVSRLKHTENYYLDLIRQLKMFTCLKKLN